MSFRTDQKKVFPSRLREERERLAPARSLPPALLAAAESQPARFTPAIRTLLCVAADAAQPVRARLHELAPAHLACVEAAGSGFVLASCREPRDALALAAALHRSRGCGLLRIGVVTGPCQVAAARAGDADFIVLPGPQRVLAEALAAQAAPGAVQLSQETLHALDDAGSSELVRIAGDGRQPPAHGQAVAPASNWAGLLS